MYTPVTGLKLLGSSPMCMKPQKQQTDRCLKVKKVTIVEIGVKSTVNEVANEILC